MTDRLAKLEQLVDRLRGPDGCAWDQEQDLPRVRSYLLEEAHEVAAAIDAGDRGEVTEELGDLLFQIVFVARLLAEAEAFTLDEVIDRVHGKMVERHPHVFGSERIDSADGVNRAWERGKRSRRGAAHASASALDGLPRTLPALVTALRLSQKAAGAGFDWSSADEVLTKLDEERRELDLARQRQNADETAEEIGDLLFVLANLARKLGVDPEAALQAANGKFRRRFRGLEELAGGEVPLADLGAGELERLWNEVKARERRSAPAGSVSPESADSGN